MAVESAIENWDVIAHCYPAFNCGLAKPPTWMRNYVQWKIIGGGFIHALIAVKPC